MHRSVSVRALPKVLLVLLLVVGPATATADEEWSWGTVGSQRSSRQPERNERTGRKHSGRLVFEDRHVKGRNPRVNLESRFESQESAATFTVNAAPSRSHRVHSVQTVDTPNRRQPRPLIISSSASDEGSRVDVPLHPLRSPDVVNVPITVTVDSSDRGHRKIESVEPGDSQGRFLNIDKKLCKMGIGWNCRKKGGGRGVDYVNLDHIPYLPQPVYPPQYSAQPSPLPYGGGIQSSDVFHVQPVALQAVGSPIQAIPLGPAGGKVPHGPVLSHGPQIHHQPSLPYGHQQVPSIPYAAGPQHHAVPILQPGYGHTKDSFQVIHDDSVRYDSPEKMIVQHIHKHTHIYQNGKPVDSTYSGSVHRPARDHKRLPVIPPHPNSLHYTSGYREACECVSSYRCASYDVVGRSPSAFSLLDARTNKKEDLVYSNNTTTEEEITTKKPSTRTKRDTNKRQTNSFLKSEERQLSFGYSPGSNGCSRGDVCCRSPARSDPHGVKTYTCGRRHAAGVVGRVKTPYHQQGDTDFGEYPWQAAILKRDGHDMVYVCGGSLVDDRHIITAAHCVNKLKSFDLQVRLGEWDVANDDEFYPNVDYSVDKLIVHPSFYAGMLQNDIAILKLDRYVDFNRYPHISPVCLPEPYSHFEGKTCHVTGWGKDAFGKTGSFQQILKKVEVPVVRKSSCEHSLQDTRLGRGFRLHDGMSCAGGEEGKDACKGDGGGPLVCRGSAGEYQLAGVVSWGIGCGERGIPGVYVDVPHYVDWIHENTRF